MMNVKIGMDEHVFICGGTGSGKTVLAEVYLSNVPSMVVKLDSKLECFERMKKGEPIWRGLENADVQIIETLSELPTVEKDRIIYAPIEEEMTEDYYNALADWVYRKTDCILWIDELMTVCPNAFKVPLQFRKLMTRGRFINSVCWICTQRPSEIPSIFMANSQHFFIYNMNLPQDRKKISEVTGCKEFNEILPKYVFRYSYIGSNTSMKGKLNLKRG